jgi:hypothetical protein
VEALDVLAVIVGAVVVGLTFLDAFDTLLATNTRAGRFTLTSTYYRYSWKSYRWWCTKVGDVRRRERLLSLYGPASFLGLLALWMVGQIIGWGLVWWGLRSSFHPPLKDLGEAFYYSGVVYFSIGFGDILASTELVRILTIVEAAGGLGTLGLVIGYLPTLSSAYSARERQLLLLDDLGDARITPVSLLRSHIGPDGDTSDLHDLFTTWEEWCADVFESHSSLPMLVLFRSKHRGHSWITALGVVTDAAVMYLAAVADPKERRAALRLHRQSVRLITYLGERVGAVPEPFEPMPTRFWSLGYTGLQQMGLELRPFDESYTRLNELGEPFHPLMEVFIQELLAPPGFWGITAADHLAQVTTDTLFRDDPD